ncbi:MAG: Uma2 family endonuclease [Cyanobacteria bacterium J06638_22]
MTDQIPQTNIAVPWLENGDRLTRKEFEHRYTHMPHLKKAELIEGVVYLPAALRYRHHSRPHAATLFWLGSYEASTPGVEAASNPTIRLDPDNEPQPDALLRIQHECGGQSFISDDDYLEGAPELIVEIAASSASYDLYDKLNAYRRNGVQEYLVWLVQDREFRWYQLKNERYILQTPNAEGVLASLLFPGLWLDEAALLTGDLATVLETLQKGIATSEHHTFVQQLQSE